MSSKLRIINPVRLDQFRDLFDEDLAVYRIDAGFSNSAATEEIARKLGYRLEWGKGPSDVSIAWAIAESEFIDRGLTLPADGSLPPETAKSPRAFDSYIQVAAISLKDCLLGLCCLMVDRDCDVFYRDDEVDRFLPVSVVAGISELSSLPVPVNQPFKASASALANGLRETPLEVIGCLSVASNLLELKIGVGIAILGLSETASLVSATVESAITTLRERVAQTVQAIYELIIKPIQELHSALCEMLIRPALEMHAAVSSHARQIVESFASSMALTVLPTNQRIV